MVGFQGTKTLSESLIPPPLPPDVLAGGWRAGSQCGRETPLTDVSSHWPLGGTEQAGHLAVLGTLVARGNTCLGPDRMEKEEWTENVRRTFWEEVEEDKESLGS